MTARRAAGGVVATATLLGLLGLVPVADAATRATAATSGDRAHAASTTAPSPDAGPLVLLLAAGGLGTMGLLSREPEPARRAGRR